MMRHRERSEYDVISMTPNPGLVSLLCALAPLGFSVLADEIAYLFDANLRVYIDYIVGVAIACCAVGLVAGILGLRRGDSRGVARVGVLANGFVLLLLVLFLTLFRLIRYGNWT